MERKFNIQKITGSFELFCIKYDVAEKSGNHKVANKFARKIINSYLQLRELGKIDALERLLYSENENVKLWTATHLLPVNEEIAKRTLNELALKSDLLGFSAKMTLNEWDNGELKLVYDGYTVKW